MKAFFQFIPVTPHFLLAPFVAKMYVFESNGRLPEEDNKLIVPNANFKLTLTYTNGIHASVAGRTFTQQESRLSLTGLIDCPVNLDPQVDTSTGTIIIELNPLGAYRFFYLSYSDLKNQILDLEDLIGLPVKNLESQLAEAASLNTKLSLLQQFLLQYLANARPDPIYDYSIERIIASKGLISVKQLEKETGYSSRWLHSKFTERLGTGPKNYAELIRFRQFYQAFAAGAPALDLKHQIYQSYHDQSHFLKAFKRFTGTTPTEMQNSMNELATRHYKS